MRSRTRIAALAGLDIAAERYAYGVDPVTVGRAVLYGRFSPSVDGSSSTANPGPSVAISKSTPFGSRT